MRIKLDFEFSVFGGTSSAIWDGLLDVVSDVLGDLVGSTGTPTRCGCFSSPYGLRPDGLRVPSPFAAAWERPGTIGIHEAMIGSISVAPCYTCGALVGEAHRTPPTPAPYSEPKVG